MLQGSFHTSMVTFGEFFVINSLIVCGLFSTKLNLNEMGVILKKEMVALALGLLQFSIANAGNKLMAEQNLQKGEYLTSANGRYNAVMQSDGNFVVYQVSPSTSRAIWSTGSSGWYARMQNDGNFVIYNQSGTWNWTSQTGGRPLNMANYLIINDDGSLEIYANYASVWRSPADPYAEPTCPSGSTLQQYPTKSYTSSGYCVQSFVPDYCPAHAAWQAAATGQTLGTCP